MTTTNTNTNGLTWDEWHHAALLGHSAPMARALMADRFECATGRELYETLRQEWRDGVDPTDTCASLQPLVEFNCYRVRFTGRTPGAIGVTHVITRTVHAPNTDAIRMTLYRLGYEHISNISVIGELPIEHAYPTALDGQTQASTAGASS